MWGLQTFPASEGVRGQAELKVCADSGLQRRDGGPGVEYHGSIKRCRHPKWGRSQEQVSMSDADVTPGRAGRLLARTMYYCIHAHISDADVLRINEALDHISIDLQERRPAGFKLELFHGT